MIRFSYLLVAFSLLAAPVMAADTTTKTSKTTTKKEPAKKTTAKTTAQAPAKKAAKLTDRHAPKKTAAPKAAVKSGSGTAILTNPGSNAIYDDYIPPASTATGDRGIAAQAFVALDRGSTTQALSLAERMRDQVLADAIRGEAYAGGASASAGELYGFLARHPDWPQRSAISAAAEGQLVSDNIYDPLMQVYNIDSQPVTTQGFNSWIATLRANGRESDARDAIRARWRSAKLVAGQEDDFRYRYGSLLTAADDRARQLALDGGVAERWKDKHLQIREYFAQRQWREAYAIASRHGIDSSNAAEYSTAEFIAGWLCLRYMNKPTEAIRHFTNVNDSVKTPVSKSRAAYWLGRTYEAMGDKVQARQWYEEGAVYTTFFYGQLSIAKIYPNTPLHLVAEPDVPSSVRSKFDNKPLPHVVRSLAAMGEQDRAARFLRTLASAADTRAEFVLTDDLARSLGKPNLEVVVAKAANQKGYILGQRGFPITSMATGELPETALALGIIRQESEFKADAESHAGALGLMQLMPATARSLARRAGVDFSERDLLNPSYNVKLGREYLGDRIQEFNGSYILAIAAYNAGRGRVAQWLDIYGDPRSPNVDPIDWIETIPVYETRNYVQRVLENTQVYRSRISSGSKSQLRIIEDLQR